jgi:hypothetical protein
MPLCIPWAVSRATSSTTSATRPLRQGRNGSGDPASTTVLVSKYKMPGILSHLETWQAVVDVGRVVDSIENKILA